MCFGRQCFVRCMLFHSFCPFHMLSLPYLECSFSLKKLFGLTKLWLAFTFVAYASCHNKKFKVKANFRDLFPCFFFPQEFYSCHIRFKYLVDYHLIFVYGTASYTSIHIETDLLPFYVLGTHT